VRIEVADHGAMVEVLVTDHGDGMTPETLAQVFEPFYQAQANAGTLGLGLAIVKGIVERHGGVVRASSAGPGRGSTFVISLPAMAELRADAPRSALDDASAGRIA
jgi:signal transduction histidine kinase